MVKLNSTQKRLYKLMTSTGESKKEALRRVQGYGEDNKSKTDGSLQCPRCQSTMNIATLSEGRRVKYCTNDRVCLPFKEKD